MATRYNPTTTTIIPTLLILFFSLHPRSLLSSPSPSPAPQPTAYSPLSPDTVTSPFSPPQLSESEDSPPPSPSPSESEDSLPPSPSPSESDESLPPSPSDGSEEETDIHEQESNSGGKKAGVTVGVVVIGACVVGLAGFVYKKRQDNIRRSQYAYVARSTMI